METLIKIPQRMTSIEIAEVTGKQHKDLMRAIRNMEPAWENVQGRNFALLQKTYDLPNGGKKTVPYYSLTKTECLYVATKFNDEARAKLVIRWEQLEQERLKENSVRRLLVTDQDVMHEAETVVGRKLEENNRKADGCITTTDIAKSLGMDVKVLNKFLRKQDVQKWQRGQYRLTPQYEGRGLAQDRLFIYYSKDGKEKECTYLVWTQKGADFIHDLVKKGFEDERF